METVSSLGLVLFLLHNKYYLKSLGKWYDVLCMKKCLKSLWPHFSIVDIGKAVAWCGQKIINVGVNKSESELSPWPTMSCIKYDLKISELVFSFVSENNNIYI